MRGVSICEIMEFKMWAHATKVKINTKHNYMYLPRAYADTKWSKVMSVIATNNQTNRRSEHKAPSHEIEHALPTTRHSSASGSVGVSSSFFCTSYRPHNTRLVEWLWDFVQSMHASVCVCVRVCVCVCISQRVCIDQCVDP